MDWSLCPCELHSRLPPKLPLLGPCTAQAPDAFKALNPVTKTRVRAAHSTNRPSTSFPKQLIHLITTAPTAGSSDTPLLTPPHHEQQLSTRILLFPITFSFFNPQRGLYTTLGFCSLLIFYEGPYQKLLENTSELMPTRSSLSSENSL